MPSLSEELIHTTVRIETNDSNGCEYTGTGFFFSFEIEPDSYVQMLVTNKHVLKDMVSAAVHLTRADDHGEPSFGKHARIIVRDLQKRVIYHPDNNVDLAIFVLADTITEMKQAGLPLYTRAALPEHLPTDDLIASMAVFEEVLMIGYPNSLWDSVNNLPIVRRGITATPFIRDYEGRAEFMIDAACFPGSSGSPIYLYKERPRLDKAGRIHMEIGFALLGILYAGPEHNVEGEIIVTTTPTVTRPVPLSRIPMNLGFCIKSRRLLDFVPEIRTRIEEFRRMRATG
jgi:Trypsin-like peptidase domain